MGVTLGAGLSAAAAKAHPSAAAPAQAEVIDLSLEPQLFVDDYLIAKTDGVFRTLNQPVKAPENPIIAPDQPWEGFLALQPGTVLFDEKEQRFKMWYNAMPRSNRPDVEEFICYATSPDGVRWEKPNLGLVEFQGSKANNIVLKWCYWTISVIHDLHDPDPGRRYKLAYWHTRDPKKCGVWVAFSPDGIRWTDHPHNPVVPCSASGDTFSVMQDPASKKYFLYHKTVVRPLRKVSRLVSDDFVVWRESRQVLEQDGQDQPDTEFYGLSAFPYAGQYLGLLWVFHTYTQFLDVQLASSRDGVAWERSAHRRIFIPLGFMRNNYSGQSFDSGMIYPASSPARKGDELWIYYSGFNHGHNLLEKEHTSRIGGAKLRLDGFCSLDATSEGSVVTKFVRFEGSEMFVNAETGSIGPEGGKARPGWSQLFTGSPDGKGNVQVEIQDQREVPIAGFRASQCKPLQGNGVAQKVSWAGGNLGRLRNQAVRIKFVISNAKLYSFRVG